jgi:hypothetical protein
MENTFALSDPLTFASPGQDGYQESVSVFNLTAQQHPAFAATATSVDHISRALEFARDEGLRLRVISTGHGSDTAKALDGEAMLRVRLNETVVVDPESRTARIPAGATWGEVAIAAAPYGLAALHGSSPLVGAIGYLLGGGMSFYGRRYGVASNLVTEIEVLLADGTRTTTNAQHDPDLFDALRGGKQALGIVLALTTELIPVTSVHTGAAFWPVSEAAQLLRAWNDWTKTAPRTASTSFRLMNLPPLPGIPPQLTAGPMICIAGAILDDPDIPAETVAAALFEALHPNTVPVLNTWHEGPPADVLVMHMDPGEPMPYVSDHQLLGELDTEAEAALLTALATERSSRLAFIELRQLGGALGVPDPRGGAINSYRGSFALYSLAALFAPDARPAANAQLANLRQTMSPWDLGITAPNMAASWAELAKSLDEATASRVRAVRLRVDTRNQLV